MLAEYQPQSAVPALWKVRLGLAARNLRQSWSMFLGTRIGVIGLVIIVFYVASRRSAPGPDEHRMGGEDL